MKLVKISTRFAVLGALLISAAMAGRGWAYELPPEAATKGKAVTETGVIESQRWSSGVPLGGIGAGKVEVFTDGSFGNATINHNWDRPTGWLRGAFAAVSARAGDGKRVARMLRLPANAAMPRSEVELKHAKASGLSLDTPEFGNVKNIAATRCRGLFPFADVEFTDTELPVVVTLHAFSPLVAQDAKASAVPGAVFEYEVVNPGQVEVEASIAFSWPNIVGFGGTPFPGEQWFAPENNSQQVILLPGGRRGLVFSTNEVASTPRRGNSLGKYALIGGNENQPYGVVATYNAAGSVLPWWKEFAEKGSLAAEADFERDPDPVASLRGEVKHQPAGVVHAQVKLAPNERKVVSFVLAWKMPDLKMQYDEYSIGKGMEKNNQGIEKAWDGSTDTSWTSPRTQVDGDQIVFDLGKVEEVTTVTLDSRKRPHNFPWGCKLESSVDGKKFSIRAWGDYVSVLKDQKDGLLQMRSTPYKARYLRARVQQTSPDREWSIDEITVGVNRGGVATDIKPTSATVELVKREKKVVETTLKAPVSTLGDSVEEIAVNLAEKRAELRAGTEAWQKPILDSSLPEWLKLKVINSAFPIVSNSVLGEGGVFTMLESPVSMGGATGTSDQRLAAHALTLMLWPELDRAELELFGAAQDLVKPKADGRIPHFTGNIHQTIGNPNVVGGVRNWPDLTASWVMQVHKYHRWTGDRKFAEAMWPRVRRAMDWLRATDSDRDHLPEGGSTFDYEPNTPGAFSYSASVTLGALRSAADLARVMGDEGTARDYDREFEKVRAAMVRRLWNGEYFIKWNDSPWKRKNGNSFVAALAGDWQTRLAGLPDIHGADIRTRALNSLLERHVKGFPGGAIPMEVTPEGKSAVDSAYIQQIEPYLGMVAIQQGRAKSGLDVLERVHRLTWEVNRDPWSQALWVEVPSGKRKGLVSYMTSPTTWFVLPALTGASLDVEGATLDLNPQVPDVRKGMRVPVYFPQFWAEVVVGAAEEGRTETARREFRVTKTFGTKPPVLLKKLRLGPDRKVKELENCIELREGTVIPF